MKNIFICLLLLLSYFILVFFLTIQMISGYLSGWGNVILYMNEYITRRYVCYVFPILDELDRDS